MSPMLAIPETPTDCNTETELQGNLQICKPTEDLVGNSALTQLKYYYQTKNISNHNFVK